MTKKEFLKTISAMGFRYYDEKNTWIYHSDFKGSVGVANFDGSEYEGKCQCTRMPSFKDFVEHVELYGKPMMDLSSRDKDVVPYDKAVVRFERLLALMKQYHKRLRLKRIKKL